METTAINLTEMGVRARDAAAALAKTSTDQRNAALHAIADALLDHADTILAENALELDEGRVNGLSEALLDRISLQGKRLFSIAEDTRSVAALPDPLNQEYDAKTLPNGLQISRRTTPLGVIGVIYEARPNVTVDVAALTLKSGNAVIMRGGKEIRRSSMAILAAMREALAASGIPSDVMQYIDSPDRRYVGDLLRLHEYVDMIIPRGGAALHQFCRENSTIPVITGGLGICHLYVDESADLDKALAIIHNAKTQRPSVCNALDTLLVHPAVAAAFLPRVVEHLGRDGVTFRAEPRALRLVNGDARVQPTGPEDFDTEWMALILGLKIVDDLDAAITHIRQHSTQHSDGILTQNMDHAARFLNEVDSSAVFLNASTRFNDGGQLGLGAEIAVSTQKLHARGPMGLQELTTYKWIVKGDGHTRA